MVHLNHFIKQHTAFIGAVMIASSSFAFGQPLALFNHFDQNNPYHFSLKYNNANDALALKNIAQYKWDEGYSPREGNNIAIINHRVDMGLTIDSWYLGYALRYDMFVKTDKSTTDILQLTNTKQTLPLGRYYDIYLEAHGIASHNLILSKTFYIGNNLKFFVGGALIHAFGVQEGFVDAYANITSDKAYDFEGFSQYYYDTNNLYTLDVTQPKGYGYSLNFGLNYTHNKHSFTFLAQDFASRIYWQNIPYSEVLIISDKKEYDKNGYIKYKPSISGYELYKDYTQELETKYLLEYQYQYQDNLDAKLALGYQNNYLLPFVALRYHHNEHINYSLGYEGRFGQISLAMEFYDFKASIASNHISHPTALSLHLSYSF